MVSEFGRSRRMQHRRFFDRDRTSTPQPGRPNGLPTYFLLPDANISGPVYIPKLYDGRNRTFFVFGWQRLQEKKIQQITNSAVPTDAMKQGDFSGIKEAMEQSLAEGSQTFEQDLARLITDGDITRDDGLAYADSPTNLMWRLQNDMDPVSRLQPKKEEVDDQPTFTEITLDVPSDDGRNSGFRATRF